MDGWMPTYEHVGCPICRQDMQQIWLQSPELRGDDFAIPCTHGQTREQGERVHLDHIENVENH